MKRIAIIGGGFAGTLTAVQIIIQAPDPMQVTLIDNETESLHRGVAYTPYSRKHVLNVAAAKMSAFPDRPDHFLKWVMSRPDFQNLDEALVGGAFLPRYLYGEYLLSLWSDALQTARSKRIDVEVIPQTVTNLDSAEDGVELQLDNGARIHADSCVIATGNQVPRNPPIRNMEFYKSPNYFQNPWRVDCVHNAPLHKPVLIIGNGLSMVDTVLGLAEHHFTGDIYSISPNGFNILPHRHSGMRYTKLVEELPEKISLFELVKLIHKHVKLVRQYGVSAEPVIDSIRPHTQRIWKGLSGHERQIFMSRLRHLWGVARHRIPLNTHDRIQQLRIDRRLHIRAGQIIDMVESSDSIRVEYFDRKTGHVQHLEVSRVINCAGPELDLLRLDSSFLKAGVLKGIMVQGPLKLGIRTDPDTFQVIDAAGRTSSNLYTLGSNLKEELWESVAVNELRDQAKRLAERLVRSSGDAKDLRFAGVVHG